MIQRDKIQKRKRRIQDTERERGGYKMQKKKVRDKKKGDKETKIQREPLYRERERDHDSEREREGDQDTERKKETMIQREIKRLRYRENHDTGR